MSEALAKNALLCELIGQKDSKAFFDKFRNESNSLMMQEKTFSFHELHHRSFYETFKKTCHESPFHSRKRSRQVDQVEDVEMIITEESPSIMTTKRSRSTTTMITKNDVYGGAHRNKKSKSKIKIIGRYRNQKIDPADKIVVIKCKKDSDDTTTYVFLDKLFELMLTHILVATLWRYNITNLSQIPPTIYQALRSCQVDIVAVFPHLSTEREEVRKRIYPVSLEDVVCVLRVLNYDGKHREEEESAMMRESARKNSSDPTTSSDDSSHVSDLSALEEGIVANGGTLTMISPDLRMVYMQHPLVNVMLECEYDCYALAATLFTLALEFTNEKKDYDQLTKRYLSYKTLLSKPLEMFMDDQLQRSQKLPMILDANEKRGIECLLRVLSRNVNTLGHLDPARIEYTVSILEFFKNASRMIQAEVITRQIRRGRFYTFEGPYTLDEMSKIIPLVLIPKRKNEYHVIAFDVNVVDPLSLHTSMSILEKRFGASIKKKRHEPTGFDLNNNQSTKDDEQVPIFHNLFMDHSRSKIYVIISKEFHNALCQYYMPYLSTCPYFIVRPGSPGLLYPIHAHNYFYGGSTGLLYSMKTLLRLFCRTPKNDYGNCLPNEEDKELGFFSFFHKIMDRFMQYDDSNHIIHNSNESEHETNATTTTTTTVTTETICRDPNLLISKLDHPFLNPLLLKYGSSRTQEREVTDENGQIHTIQEEVCVATGFKREIPTIYTGIKAMCFMKGSHEISTVILRKLHQVFCSSTELQLKWDLLWQLVQHLMEKTNDLSATRNIVDQVYIPRFFLPHEEFPFPNYLLFYVFIAQETEVISNEFAFELFISISVNYSSRRRTDTQLAPSHPGLCHMGTLSIARYKDYFSEHGAGARLVSADESNDHNDNDNESRKALYVLFEYLEQHSYFDPNKPFEDFVETAERRKETLVSSSKGANETFVRWCPISYDLLIKSRLSNHRASTRLNPPPLMPAYFDEKTSRAMHFYSIFPIWKSEFLNGHSGPKNTKRAKESTRMSFTDERQEQQQQSPLKGGGGEGGDDDIEMFPDSASEITHTNKTRVSDDLRPLAGCHPKFLQLVTFYPCSYTMNLLPPPQMMDSVLAKVALLMENQK